MAINFLDSINIKGLDGGVALDIQGSQGQLFSVTDDLSGDIFAVSDISGVPILNVNSNGTSYFDGKLGIGTASPQYPLHVAGSSSVTAPTGNGVLMGLYGGNYGHIQMNGSAGSYIDFSQSGVDHKGRILYDNAANYFRLDTNGAEKMRITSAGNVGIGTTAPTAILQVTGSVSSDWAGRFENTSTTGYGLLAKVASTDAGDYIFQARTGATNVMTITASQNVGIGTTNPAKKLHVISSSNEAQIRLGQSGSGSYDLGVYANDTFSIGRDADTQEFNIKNGNVGIGTTNPASKLDVSGTYRLQLRTDDTIPELRSITADGTAFKELGLNGSALVFKTSSSEKMRLLANGNFGIGITSPQQKLHIVSTDGANIILNSNTGAENNGIWMTEGGVATPYVNGAYFHYDGSSNEFKINTGAASLSTRFTIARDTGAIKFNNYNSTNSTGTPTFLLGTDASGNVVKTNTIPGSGAGPYLPLAGGTMTGTNGVLFPDNFKLKLGDATTPDLEIYHSGNDSYIKDSGQGDLRIVASATKIYDADMSHLQAQFIDGGAVTLYNVGNQKFTTTNTGVTITGGWVTNGVSVATANIEHTDNTKSLFGNGNDLAIYHDGTHSYIDGITNDLYIRTVTPGDDIVVQAYDDLFLYTNNGLDAIIARGGGGVEAYYNNSKKFETTNTGVTVTGAATAGTFIGDLNGTINTATTAATQANATNNTTVATTAFVQNLIGTIPAGLVFQGTWNAATNTPTLTSGSGTTGHFYIVSTSGSTNLDGVTDWVTGDWAVFIEQGGTDAWEKIDNSSVLDGAGTGQTVALWSGSGTSNTLTNAPITVSGNNATFAGNVALTGNLDVNLGEVQMTDGYSVQWGGNAILNHTGSQTRIGDNTSSSVLTLAGGNATFTGDVIVDSALLSHQQNTDVDTGTETIAQVAIATYTAAFFDFVVKKGTNVRSGTVYACHDGTNVEYAETSTVDLGDTSDLVLTVDISAGNMRLLGTAASVDWSVKSLIRAI